MDCEEFSRREEDRVRNIEGTGEWVVFESGGKELLLDGG